MARRKQPKPKAVHQLTVAQFDALFQTEDDCIKYLVARRWTEGVICPRCGNIKVYALASVIIGNANNVRRTAIAFRISLAQSLRTRTSPSKTGIASFT